MEADINTLYRVLESPDCYCCPSWKTERLARVQQMIEQPTEACLIHVDRVGQVIRKRINPEQLREQLGALLHELGGAEEQTLFVTWYNFWAAQADAPD